MSQDGNLGYRTDPPQPWREQWSPGWASTVTWVVVAPLGLLVGLGLVLVLLGGVFRSDLFLSAVGFFGLAAVVLGGPAVVLGILYLRRRTRSLFWAFVIVLLISVALVVHAQLTDGTGILGFLGLLWFITYMPDTTDAAMTGLLLV